MLQHFYILFILFAYSSSSSSFVLLVFIPIVMFILSLFFFALPRIFHLNHLRYHYKLYVYDDILLYITYSYNCFIITNYMHNQIYANYSQKKLNYINVAIISPLTTRRSLPSLEYDPIQLYIFHSFF